MQETYHYFQREKGVDTVDGPFPQLTQPANSPPEAGSKWGENLGLLGKDVLGKETQI